MFTLGQTVKKTIVTGALLMASTSLWAAEHWIDVRTPDQYQETHVEGATNIPLKQLEARIGEVTKDKDDTLHLYCNTGNQSGKAEKMLQELGYKHAINEGGLKDVEKTQKMVQ
ncbi:thiosulfate sulfurtransferase PspE [Klebsiella sp. B345]|uniref:Thiosulfate sulfurtransferase PspE n=1 Tax=Raoultella lignicola TaxID=3040939 RepID=A0ABU9F834_9ENTR|nr:MULTISPECIES: thiosulfate sulfurtransferase PspE [Klebsiella/Raoultella group]MRT52054.1 thiosulfate sulfurtransferase PspE [Raoultella sp. RIT712]ROS07456.1 thiosulfate sulfurtransferase [Raoultella sp. BIGb0399]